MIKETGISLAEALELEQLKSCELIAGRSGINNIITRVNIMADLDILNWIEEGEFLLTTAVHFGNISVEEQMDLLRNMRVKGIEAIAIKIKPYIDKLDDRIIALADEIKLPIMSLDYSVSFADVMEPLLKEIFDKQSQVIRRVEAVHNEVMGLLLKGGSVVDITKELSKKVGNRIIVKDYYFDEVIGSKENCEDSINIEHEISKYIKENNISIKNNRTYCYKIQINQNEHEVYAIPIIARSNVYGNIFLVDMNRKIQKRDVQMLESASSILALELLKKISIQEIENKYKVEFFDDLISSDKLRKSKAIERSNYYKFDKDANYCTYSIAISDGGKKYIDKMESLNRDISKIMYLIDSYCTNKDIVFLVANRKSQVNVVLMLKDKNKLKEESLKLAAQFEEIISQKIINIDFIIGVGRVYNGIDNMYRSLNDSQKAVTASEYYSDEKIIVFDDLGIYKIFCNSILKDELYDFYANTLEPLVNYDKKRDTELVKTLKVYFESNGNLKKMSEKLFTHYNTVLYRVNRIQEITHTSLDNEKERYGLQTAIKIFDMLGLDKQQ